MTDIHNAEMVPVLSSHILGVGHDPEKGLIVEFVDGAVVAYPDAPPGLVERITQSASPGAALHSFVKSKGMPHRYLAAPLRVPKRWPKRR